jgi:hypothetical protein
MSLSCCNVAYVPPGFPIGLCFIRSGLCNFDILRTGLKETVTSSALHLHTVKNW